MTTIQDTITYIDGRLANGRVVVTWPAFQMNGSTVAGGQQAWDIINGVLSMTVYSNSNARPVGIYYTAVFELDEGALYTEWWVVPNLPVVSLGQVRIGFPVTPSAFISAQQLTSAGATYGQFLGWNGTHWVPMYVTTINISPNTIGLGVTNQVATDLSVSGSPAALGGALVLNVPDAGPTSRGVVTTGAQVFAGAKTFQNTATFSNGIVITGGSTIAGYVPTSRLINTGYGLTGGGDLSADRTLAVVDDTSVQKILVYSNTTLEGTRHALNFIPGSNVALTIADNPSQDWVDLTITSTGGTSLPAGATAGDILVWQTTPTLAWSILSRGPAGNVLTAGTAGINWAAPVGVISVFGRTGAVTAMVADYSAFYVPLGRQVLAGTGLSGGGPLTADVTLNAIAMGASGAAHAAGIVPDPGAVAGATRFLREDATWQVVSAVASVFGRTGAVVATSGDYSAFYVPLTRQVLAGAGMTGGGPLSADQTLAWLGVQAALAGTVQGTEPQLNFVAGSGTTLSVTDIPGSKRVDITIGLSGTGPPTNSVYSVNGTTIGTRSQLNLASGASIALTGVDNSAAGRVDITIAATVMGASGATHAAGTAPDPGATAGTTRYLREDASWAVPPGGSGGVTSISGLTGAVTLVAGANVTITPSGQNITIAASGSGGGGTPAAPVGSVQFNSAGAFGGSANLTWDSTNNRLGIGTASPAYTLQVNGSIALTSKYVETPTQLYQTNGNGVLQLQCHNASNAEIPVQIFVPDNSGAIAFNTSASVVPPTAPTFTERMRITNQGAVGIGTTSPVSTLHVFGASNFPSLTADGATVTIGADSSVQLILGGYHAPPYGFWLQTKINTNAGASYPLLLNPLGGNVGIGTTNPQTILHCYKNQSGAVTAITIDNDGGGSSGEGQAIKFAYGSTGVLGGIYHQLDTSGNWCLRFKAWNNSAEVERITIRADTGNVGIGQLVPAYTLDINGDCNLATGHVYRIGGTPITGMMQTPWLQDIDGGNHNLSNVASVTASALYASGIVAAYSGADLLGTNPVGFQWQTNNKLRWEVEKVNTESGSNTGSDLGFARFDDTGTQMSPAFCLFMPRNTGYVGVGCVPAYPLDINGDCNLATGHVYRVSGVPISTGGGTPAAPVGSVQFNSAGAFGGNANLTWDNTNFRLGIGTASPSVPLEVAGADGYIARFHGPTAGFFIYSVGADYQIGTATGNLYFDTNATQRMSITSTGNVGIGTTSPASLLTVDLGSSAISSLVSTILLNASYGTAAGGIGIDWSVNRVVKDMRIAGVLNSSGNAGELAFYTNAAGSLTVTNATEKMRITGAGKVGIATAAPSSLLSVNGCNGNTGNAGFFGLTADGTNGVVIARAAPQANPMELWMGVNQASSYVGIQGAQAGVGYGTAVVLQPSGGNVGIGTTNPSYRLHVSGGRSLFQPTENYALGLANAGSAYMWLGVNSSADFLISSNTGVTYAKVLQASGGIILGAPASVDLNQLPNGFLVFAAQESSMRVAVFYRDSGGVLRASYLTYT